jgi:hypothetical protein
MNFESTVVTVNVNVTNYYFSDILCDGLFGNVGNVSDFIEFSFKESEK